MSKLEALVPTATIPNFCQYSLPGGGEQISVTRTSLAPKMMSSARAFH